jgi:hypothetical protein
MRKAIAAWQTDQTDTRIVMGGHLNFSTGGTLSGGDSNGRTYMQDIAGISALQEGGYVRKILANISNAGAATGWKFKLFRPDGSGGFTLVAETEKFTAAGTGNQYFTPATPLGPCQAGDRIGVWILGISGTALKSSPITGTNTILWGSGDLSSSSGFTAAISSFALDIQLLGVPPFIIGTGDSIMEGHNSFDAHHSWRDGGPSGNVDAEILHQMRALVPTLDYMNYGLGGATWSTTLSVASAIAAKKPRAVLVQCGVNDISGGRTWADVESDMDDFLAAMASETHLFVDEILPWTAGTDAQAATVRTFNANYATWCADNGATLITAHDLMAQIRTSTGELDDIKTDYGDGGGVHYSILGDRTLAEIWSDQMNAYSWTG